MLEGRLRKGHILVFLAILGFTGLFASSVFIIQTANWRPYVSPNEWIQNYPRRSYDDTGQVLVQCENGDIILGGDNYGDHYLFAIRVTPLGQLVWEIDYSVWAAHLDAIIPFGDNQYLLLGGDSGHGFALCIDGSGTELWIQRYKQFNGSSSDHFYAGIPCNGGGALCVGSSRTNTTDLWVLRIDDTGTPLWNMSYDLGAEDFGNKAIECADNSFLVVGAAERTPDGPYDSDLILLRVQPNGTLSWVRTYSTSHSWFPRGLVRSHMGGYLIIGTQGGDTLLMEVDELGNQIGNATINGIEPTDFIQCEMGYLLIGINDFYDGRTRIDYLVALRLDDLIHIVWQWTYGIRGSIEDPYRGDDGVEAFQGGFFIITSGGERETAVLLVRIPEYPTPGLGIAAVMFFYFGLIIGLFYLNTKLQEYINQRVEMGQRNSPLTRQSIFYNIFGLTFALILLLYLLPWVIVPIFATGTHSLYMDVTSFIMLYTSPAGMVAILCGVLAFTVLQLSCTYYEYEARQLKGKSDPISSFRLIYAISILFFVVLGSILFGVYVSSYPPILLEPFSFELVFLFSPFIFGALLSGFYPRILFLIQGNRLDAFQ
ncbi:MAG: hypothetical protein ACXACF_10030 [Candidatus Hermodarchaeia archaeon]|jgi:hypothetical protein